MTDALQYFLGGGIVGVLVTQFVTSLRAWWARRRERKGLLQILYTEIAQNKHIIDYVAPLLELPDATTVLSMRGRYVSAEAWKAVRVELSKNISRKSFAALSDYYKNVLLLEEVVTLERARTDEDPQHETRSDIIQQAKLLVQALSELESEIQQLIRKQVRDVTARDKYAELVRNQELRNLPNS